MSQYTFPQLVGYFWQLKANLFTVEEQVSVIEGTVSDGNKGDITLSSGGTSWVVNSAAITYGKIQDVSAASRLLGRGDSGAGNVQELTLGTNLSITGTTLNAASGGVTDGDKGDIDPHQADVATASVFYRKTAGTGAPEVQTLATLKTDLNLSGTNTGDQTSIVGITGTKAQFDTAVTDGNFLYVGDITQYTDEMAQDAVGAMVDGTLIYTDGTPLLSRATLTGDVIASAGSNALTIPADTVTYAKMQNVSAASRLLGRGDSGAGDPQEITLGANLTMAGTTLSASGGGGGGNSGVSTIDFGAFPGKSDTSVPVTGQAGILAGSAVTAVLQATATADHSIDEHMVENIKIVAGNIIAGTGFTIYAMNPDKNISGQQGTTNFRSRRYGGGDTRLYGTWTVAWRWS